MKIENARLRRLAWFQRARYRLTLNSRANQDPLIYHSHKIRTTRAETRSIHPSLQPGFQNKQFSTTTVLLRSATTDHVVRCLLLRCRQKHGFHLDFGAIRKGYMGRSSAFAGSRNNWQNCFSDESKAPIIGESNMDERLQRMD